MVRLLETPDRLSANSLQSTRPLSVAKYQTDFDTVIPFGSLMQGLAGMSKEMILSIGQVLRVRNATYRLLDALHAPMVFKAQVLDSLAVISEL